MTTNSPVQIVCPHCVTKNRLPQAKLGDKPICGKCGKTLLTTQPVIGSDQHFQRFIANSDLPVVVDFWAPWCGPCKQFAPTFEATAADMATQACFMKLNTEQNQATAGGYHIRSIPTLMIFHKGKEVTRLSGALSQPQFKQWLTQHLPKQ
ncbi:thioredoxin TrxC [Marinomonas algarum]|uniref:Thioredoxin n=1 Tax=Marinomonas algarum TaxID=2883105 RepID=A0A9X1LEA1_9GAMM|nr:thioredoxin TrxC [Marinomonas algarum]MCB5160780.1 thioredoxin TrxC [Marinomonas algarum]